MLGGGIYFCAIYSYFVILLFGVVFVGGLGSVGLGKLGGSGLRSHSVTGLCNNGCYTFKSEGFRTGASANGYSYTYSGRCGRRGCCSSLKLGRRTRFFGCAGNVDPAGWTH